MRGAVGAVVHSGYVLGMLNFIALNAIAALGLVIGGALGNAADRAFRGAVADFFYFHYQSFSWYVFNVADIAIVAGVALLMYESVVIGDRDNRRGKA